MNESKNDYKIEHIEKPSGITNSPYNMIPYLPDKELFFDSRHWTYGLADGILPFSLTTRISANNQQFLKVIEKETCMKESKNRYDLYDCFYWNKSPDFQRPPLKNIGRTITTDNHAPAVVVPNETMCMNESKIPDKVIQVANIVDDTNIGFKNPQRGRVYSAQGISPAVYCFQGGNLEPKIIETNMADQNAIELPSELKGKKFRIRKLTPRECFRLMGVDDKDIDKIQAAGVSNSGQYKLAGNSIVVDVLFHIFRKMFIETDNESQQLTLF